MPDLPHTNLGLAGQTAETSGSSHAHVILTFPGRWAGLLLVPGRETEASDRHKPCQRQSAKEPRLNPLSLHRDAGYQ